jgi:hypothetical protein
MPDLTINEMLAIAAAAEDAQTAQQSPPGPTPPADAQAVQPAPGVRETDAQLEARLKAAYADRQRNAGFEADRPANEELMNRALAARGISPPDKSDSTPNVAPVARVRLDGQPFNALDNHLTIEMARLFPHLDIDGSRRPVNERR